MNWETLKNEIYYWDGSWRDIYVKETNEDDWLKWVSVVNNKYRIQWFNPKTNKEEMQIDFEVIREYWNGNQDLFSSATIYIDEIQIKSHFFDDAEIENDIDPREFKSIDDHHKLVNYLKLISQACGKEVILTPENSSDYILMNVNQDKAQLMIGRNNKG